MGLKVAIVGLAGTASLTPWDDASWEVWGLNAGHLAGHLFRRADGTFRADRWFQIHPPEGCNAAEVDWFAQLEAGVYDVPTYVRAADLGYWSSRYPTAAKRGRLVPFPADELADYLAAGWVVNTFCLEMALALHLGAEEVALFGVECGSFGREVVVERPGVAYWLGILASHGVQLDVAAGTLYPYKELYGLEYWAEAQKAAEITDLVFPGSHGGGENLDTVAQVVAAQEKVHA